MNIKKFIEIVDDYFNIINPNFCNNYDVENEYKEDSEDNELWKIVEDFFEQIGPQI